MTGQGIGRGSARRAVFAVAACVAALALVPAAAAADEAEALYDPGTVWVVDLQLSEDAIKALEADPEGEYQKGTFSIAPSDGTPDGVGTFSTPQAMEIRLKGSASFRDLSEKAAFKIKFPKAGPFLGLRKMTLNNMVEDPSMTHETLSYELHRALGVPASRTGFVYLRLNGEDFGVYMNVENYDNVAMAKKFGSFDGDVQHVYEGENGADLKPELVGSFEVDEGPDDISDLEALAAAVNETDPEPWSSVVGPLADLKEMTRMWAAEKYSGQFDGYAGGPAADHPNNYFLATGPDSLFRMLPWGQDETWKEDNHLPFEGPAGLMFEKCLADEGCKAEYVEALKSLRSILPGLDLDALAASTAQLLGPWQELEEEESTRFEYDAGEIAAAVAETREFIATRPQDLEDYLPDETEVPFVQIRGEGPPPTEQTPAAQLSAVTRKGKRLRVAVVSPRSGPLKLTAKTTGRRGVRVCARRTTVEAGAKAVTCRLSRTAIQKLEQGSLRLSVTVRFLTDGTSFTRQVRLPRL